MKHLLMSISIILLFIGASFITVYAESSETFPLSPLTSIVRNVELQEDDRLVGSFTINNLQTWKNAWGETQSYEVSVTVKDPKGQVVLSYTKTEGDSFDYTAFYSGVYTIQFYCGISYYPPSGIENPQATLSYNIITPSDSDTSIFANFSIWQMIPIVAGAIISVIIIVTYYAVKSNRNKHTLECSL